MGRSCSVVAIDDPEEATRTARRELVAGHRLVAAGSVYLAGVARRVRSEEHTSELQSQFRISYAVFCLKKKKKQKKKINKKKRK